MVGPSFGREATERSTRNSIAAACIRKYDLAELLPRVSNIEEGTDKEMDARLKEIALFADKIGSLASFYAF